MVNQAGTISLFWFDREPLPHIVIIRNGLGWAENDSLILRPRRLIQPDIGYGLLLGLTVSVFQPVFFIGVKIPEIAKAAEGHILPSEDRIDDLLHDEAFSAEHHDAVLPV